MSTLFVLRNQQGLFLSRQGEWVSGREATTLFRAKNKDEAFNEVFEVSSKDINQRVQVESVAASAKGQPVVPEEWIVDILQEDAELEQDADRAEAAHPGATESAIETESLAPDTGEARKADLFQAQSA